VIPPTAMTTPFLKVLSPGLGAAFQDQGRPGWQRFGVPIGGAMDAHAAALANRLLGNPPWSAVIELLLHGARLQVMQDCWLALTGADLRASHPRWRAFRAVAGEIIQLGGHTAGVWAYLALEGGFAAPHWLDSASTLPSAGLGQPLEKGQRLYRCETEPRFLLPTGVAARIAAWPEQRDYSHPPPLRLWPGPQWEWFSHEQRSRFFDQSWTVAAQSNRIGYRLHGEPLTAPHQSMISEPVRVGSVQIPPNGQPLVLLRDGPTVGGYPKLGVLDPEDVDWLVQSAPSQQVRFSAVVP
jgi:biotin-dependent carboxylase-like uncharacterized protein